MNKNIILCGVGGQGTVLASKLIAAAAMEKGIPVMSAETIGMAQRGGSVFSHVRMGENLYSPMIAKGTADMILGFEPGETVRMLPYLKKNGAVVVSNRAVMPVTASLAKTGYNGAAMIEYLKTQVDQVLVIDTDQACETLGSAKVLNVLMLGAAISTGMLGLEKEDIKTLLKRAVYDQEKGMGSYHAEIDEEALEFLADIAGGDARNALNAIELGILTTERSADGKIHITLDVASECIQKRVVRYDKTGDNHYDTISAFIKSMRGSDPDAAVYYLAKMLYAGEDVKFIARRIMICASEDVGNADPMALQVAVAAAQAVERIGMPESQIILSQAVTYVATAPKSNAAVKAISAAMENVRNYKTTVPAHLQDAHYKGAADLGRGTGYQYAHDYPNHYVEQQYMPSEIQKAKFYEPSDNGHEKEIKEWMEFLKKNS